MLRTRLFFLLIKLLQFISGRCAVFATFSDLLALRWLVMFLVGSLLSHLRPSVVVASMKHGEAVADAREGGLGGEDDVKHGASTGAAE